MLPKSMRAQTWVLAVAALLIITAGSILSSTAPVFWVPPTPAEPDDTIYTSPFTFDALTNGGTEDPDVGPQARIAAAWQLLGGRTALPLVWAMAQEAETQRQLYRQQLPGGVGASGTPTWVSLGPTTENHWQNGGQPNPQINSGRLNTILVNPTNPDTVYVIAATGGYGRPPTSPNRIPPGLPSRMRSELTELAQAPWARIPIPSTSAPVTRSIAFSEALSSARQMVATLGDPRFNYLHRSPSI